MTKRFLHIVFLFGPAVLAACTQKAKVPEPSVPELVKRVEGPASELQSIDSLMWHQPDSTQARLCCRDALHVSPQIGNNDSIARRNHCVSTDQTFDNHYHQLLVSELL